MPAVMLIYHSLKLTWRAIGPYCKYTTYSDDAGGGPSNDRRQRNVHQKLGEVQACGFRSMRANRQTDIVITVFIRLEEAKYRSCITTTKFLLSYFRHSTWLQSNPVQSNEMSRAQVESSLPASYNQVHIQIGTLPELNVCLRLYAYFILAQL